METETVVNNLRFPGQYFDAETGLHYNFQRYYEPGSGRYVWKDPIGFKGGSVNLYEYAKGNPSNRIDPRGLDVYVVGRPLDMFQDFDANEWRTWLNDITSHKNNLMDFASRAGFSDADVLRSFDEQKIEGYLKLIEFYAKHTWHCQIVVVTECDTQQTYKPWLREETKPLEQDVGYSWWKPATIRQLTLIDPSHTADFNNRGSDSPAADWHPMRYPVFPQHKYSRIFVKKVVAGHAMDDAVLQAINDNKRQGFEYIMAGDRRYNCCDWAAETLAQAGVTPPFLNPNPIPFGDVSGMIRLIELVKLFQGEPIDIDGQLNAHIFDAVWFRTVQFLIGVRGSYGNL